jgi:hypothetical protein
MFIFFTFLTTIKLLGVRVVNQKLTEIKQNLKCEIKYRYNESIKKYISSRRVNKIMSVVALTNNEPSTIVGGAA